MVDSLEFSRQCQVARRRVRLNADNTRYMRSMDRMYLVLSVHVTFTSMHYAISVHVWHSTLSNLLQSVPLVHVLITATAIVCSTAHLSATRPFSTDAKLNSQASLRSSATELRLYHLQSYPEACRAVWNVMWHSHSSTT